MTANVGGRIGYMSTSSLLIALRIYDSLKRVFLETNITEWKHVANNMVPADSESCWVNLEKCLNSSDSYPYYTKYHVHGNRTHAFVRSYLFNADKAVIPNKKDWYRSREALSLFNSYAAKYTSNNWILNEVFKLN